MNQKYDIFEVLPDSAIVWRLDVRGMGGALQDLETIGKETTNECFAIDLKTRKVIGRVNQLRDAMQITVDEAGTHVVPAFG